MKEFTGANCFHEFWEALKAKYPGVETVSIPVTSGCVVQRLDTGLAVGAGFFKGATTRYVLY